MNDAVIFVIEAGEYTNLLENKDAWRRGSQKLYRIKDIIDE